MKDFSKRQIKLSTEGSEQAASTQDDKGEALKAGSLCGSPRSVRTTAAPSNTS